MMVDELRTPFNMSEHGNILSRSVGLCHVEYARRHDVEVACIERKLLVEGSNDESIVAELWRESRPSDRFRSKRACLEGNGVFGTHTIDRCGTLVESLKFANPRFVSFKIQRDGFWRRLPICLLLSINKVDRESFGVLEGNHLPTARRIDKLLNPRRQNFDVGN
jgi:hypothetical protein